MFFVFCLLHVYAYDSEAFLTDTKNEFKAGFTTIQKETINGPTTVVAGYVPKWIDGVFIRHACRTFGDVDHMNPYLPNFVEHLFDCLPMASLFTLREGNVIFTNRFYNSAVDQVYDQYFSKSINISGVFWSTLFSNSNSDQMDRWRSYIEAQPIPMVPHSNWWSVGNELIAVEEMPDGVVIDAHDATIKGQLVFNDNNLGIPDTKQFLFSNNAPFLSVDPDGVVWGVTGVVEFVTPTYLNIWRLVYTIGADKVRRVVGEYKYADSNLTLCHGNKPYPEFDARFGWVQSFAVTDNYVILPETALMDDPCVFTHYDRHKPFYKQGFLWEQNGFSRLTIMRKSDGIFVASLKTRPFFATHQVGSFESNGRINVDLLMYPDNSIYKTNFLVRNLLNGMKYATRLVRISINTTDWSHVYRNIRGGYPTALEMPRVNKHYSGKKYSYVYLTKNYMQQDRNAIVKINVDSRQEVEHSYDHGQYVFDSHFIPNPNSTVEDDGVLLVQGLDGNFKKGFLSIIDARSLISIGHVVAPDIVTFGQHSRFIRNMMQHLFHGSIGAIG